MNTMLGGTAAIRARGLQRAEPLSSASHSSGMTLAIARETPPMEARLTDEIPAGEGWQFEPKWDGFRTLVFRDGEEILLQSRDERPMNRYFPELLAPLRATVPERCVLDGEIVIVGAQGLDFEALLLRIHPAASRVTLLARQSPASFVAWDLLAVDAGARRQILVDALIAVVVEAVADLLEALG